jgi:phosphonoacetate hydrolase
MALILGVAIAFSFVLLPLSAYPGILPELAFYALICSPFWLPAVCISLWAFERPQSTPDQSLGPRGRPMFRRRCRMLVAWVLACILVGPIVRGQTSAEPPLIKGNQRVVIAMIDGLGPDYVEQSPMPVLKGLMAKGFTKTVAGVMPSVTNVNNASIATSTWPSEHGITGNSFFDEAKGQAEYMENAKYLLRPTLFERASKRGVKSALLTAKKKTVALLGGGADLAIAAESPFAEQIAKYGTPPPIYSSEINHWLWAVAVDLLKNRPELGLLYVHTTDYPMHTWPASAQESKNHLARLDSLLGQAVVAAPDAAFLITADHGLNAKSRCWDLARACKNRGLEIKFALSAERDKYVKHHRTFGGTGYVWLRSPSDAAAATKILRGLNGVEDVLTRDEAANRFHLKPERIGELVVLGDRETVFGETAPEFEMENLPPTFRTHGSLHEATVPVVIYNASGTLPAAESIRVNFEMTRTLYRD